MIEAIGAAGLQSLGYFSSGQMHDDFLHWMFFQRGLAKIAFWSAAIAWMGVW